MATQLVLDEQLRSFAAAPSVRGSAPALSGPIVLGLDGSDTGRGAAALALSLAREWGAPLRVLSVLEPPRDVWVNGAEWRRDAAREHDRRAALARFADAASANGVTCDAEIERGCAVTHLIECARSSGAALIVLGLRDSGEPAPVLVDETGLQVIRRSPSPVLAVTPAVSELPRRAIAAVDFSPASLHAARAALRVLQPGGTLFLVHVQPDFSSAASRSDGVQVSYSRAITSCFDPARERARTTTLHARRGGGARRHADRGAVGVRRARRGRADCGWHWPTGSHSITWRGPFGHGSSQRASTYDSHCTGAGAHHQAALR